MKDCNFYFHYSLHAIYIYIHYDIAEVNYKVVGV